MRPTTAVASFDMFSTRHDIARLGDSIGMHRHRRKREALANRSNVNGEGRIQVFRLPATVPIEDPSRRLE
ncbi:unnamed protein product [Soboliphyme baturini]|uniref:Uncharacterized protein n=1 Tax=Soboliphyme baturini TaxID=241478 RepID=A0A183J4D8_9BILA|nr:unnamed protein product [Soboliphyme baturini]